MEAVKKVFKAGGFMCMLIAILSKSVAFAFATVVFTVVAMSIEIKDWEK